MRPSFLALAALCVSSLAAHAVPITYTVTDIGSGTLGSTVFTNELITVSFMGDTSNVSGGGGFYTNSAGIGTVQIGSGTVATFTGAVDSEFFVNETFAPPAVGIGGNQGSILDTESSVFATYTGATALGPITGAVYYNPGTAFATTSGDFTINSAAPTSTFVATTATPEPSSFALLGTGLMAVMGVVRKRFA